jgi:hypothetical protein
MSLLTHTIKGYYAGRDAAMKRTPLFMANRRPSKERPPRGVPKGLPKRPPDALGREFVVPKSDKVICNWLAVLAARTAHLDCSITFRSGKRAAKVTAEDGFVYSYDGHSNAATDALGSRLGIDYANLCAGDPAELWIEGEDAGAALPIVEDLLAEGPPADPIEYRRLLKKHAVLRRIKDPAERRAAALKMLEADWSQSRAERWLCSRDR